MVDSLGITSIQIPHQSHPPRRYTGGASQHTVMSPVVHYRTEFYKMLDNVDVQLRDRFSQPDLDVLQKLEETLLTGEVSDIVDQLLLVVPVSSAEAERSFSALRRLKTWLRTTMTQVRLNRIAVCHVHQDKLEKIDVKQICQQFISGNDRHRHVFGLFK
ncbi:zinc finger MYM-type protein 1-like [Tachysurus ichikawai]